MFLKTSYDENSMILTFRNCCFGKNERHPRMLVALLSLHRIDQDAPWFWHRCLKLLLGFHGPGHGQSLCVKCDEITPLYALERWPILVQAHYSCLVSSETNWVCCFLVLLSAFLTEPSEMQVTRREPTWLISPCWKEGFTCYSKWTVY